MSSRGEVWETAEQQIGMRMLDMYASWRVFHSTWVRNVTGRLVQVTVGLAWLLKATKVRERNFDRPRLNTCLPQQTKNDHGTLTDEGCDTRRPRSNKGGETGSCKTVNGIDFTTVNSTTRRATAATLSGRQSLPENDFTPHARRAPRTYHSRPPRQSPPQLPPQFPPQFPYPSGIG